MQRLAYLKYLTTVDIYSRFLIWFCVAQWVIYIFKKSKWMSECKWSMLSILSNNVTLSQWEDGKRGKHKWLYFCRGCWKEVWSHTELRGTLVCAWRRVSINISKNVVCAWYVSWNDWNVPHVHGPRFNAPFCKLVTDWIKLKTVK